ncbi:MAG TPA: endonuclease, partial [Clostridia bacterium]|nr:endonuclease [Clostridia bacterium]
PFFIVDAYTRRILSRVGYKLPKTYDQLRLKIEASIPRDLYIYNEFHALFVEHAKCHCLKSPRCEGCPLACICAEYD